jgi:uracil-DNA glycosylase family 4
MKNSRALAELNDQIVKCRLCPRIVAHREEVARIKRRAYLDWEYWGRAVPSFGTTDARLLIVGLAPGAHGANRTGRIFTGDSSGDFLYATLYRYGFSNQPQSKHPDDGLELRETYITAALHCVPPQNKPSRIEVLTCRPFLAQELDQLEKIEVIVALGGIAWQAVLHSWLALGRSLPVPRPKFGHREETGLNEKIRLIGSYHPSRQNTQTGRLSVEMFEGVFKRARQLIHQ